jgi:hypothetical protein
MKKKLALLGFAVFMVMMMGCSSSTQYGNCVGIGEEQDPNLVYKVSAQNLIVGIVFFELIAPPVLVAVNEFYCPVGVK